MKPSDFSQSKVHDEIAKMRSEIDTLRNSVELIKQELSLCKETIDELSREGSGRPPVKQDELDPIDRLCKTYLDTVSSMDIVRQVFLVKAGETATIWTVVDAPPSEDPLRTPIYDEQVNLLNILKGNLPIDFYILNVLELTGNEQPGGVIPADAKLIWER
ncbi:hypothetical protein ES703_85296 [subsurface metagenome]